MPALMRAMAAEMALEATFESWHWTARTPSMEECNSKEECRRAASGDVFTSLCAPRGQSRTAPRPCTDVTILLRESVCSCNLLDEILYCSCTSTRCRSKTPTRAVVMLGSWAQLQRGAEHSSLLHLLSPGFPTVCGTIPRRRAASTCRAPL